MCIMCVIMAISEINEMSVGAGMFHALSKAIARDAEHTRLQSVTDMLEAKSHFGLSPEQLLARMMLAAQQPTHIGITDDKIVYLSPFGPDNETVWCEVQIPANIRKRLIEQLRGRLPTLQPDRHATPDDPTHSSKAFVDAGSKVSVMLDAISKTQH